MSERAIYEGCLALMGGLVDRFEEYLKKAGIDQTAAGEPFRAEVACSEPDSRFFKTWEIEHEGDLYKVHVS